MEISALTDASCFLLLVQSAWIFTQHWELRVVSLVMQEKKDLVHVLPQRHLEMWCMCPNFS